MKKFSLILAAVVLSASFAACGGNDDERTANDTLADTGADTSAAAETIAETTEEATTVYVETEPPMVEVFTPIAVDNFDDPDNTSWRQNAQMKDFTVADGYMTATSTGGDPSIVTKSDLNLNCEDIAAVRVRFLNGTANDSIQLFFTTDTTTGFCEEASYKEITWNTEIDCDRATVSERAEDEWDEIVFYTDTNDLWTGTLKKVRIDLSNGEGQYLVDYISFDSISMEPAN
ncbi:MAG: hypothetical protein ACI3XM_03495 [Eubacteriales bacterium]